MRLTKRRIWILGIIAAAAVLTPTLTRYLAPSRILTVQLIDERSGERVTNVTVTVRELYEVPLVSSLKFIPVSQRFRFSNRVVHADRGEFEMKRLSGRGALVSQSVSLAFNGEQPSIPHLLYTKEGIIQQFRYVPDGVSRAPENVVVPPSGPLIIRTDPTEWGRLKSRD